ncbi:TPA: 30S ribosomal protein S8 [Patescibacteria group bacterium]|nr:30S ribosomal protein S8 [Patescibacteria group bacterium]
MNDYISDLLARLHNGIIRKKEVIIVPNSKAIIAVLEVLKQEKMIENFEKVEKMIEVRPIYEEDGRPLVKHFTRVSRPGQRMYVSSKELTPVMNGRGINIISTSSGVMTGAMAKSKNLGGELICKVW